MSAPDPEDLLGSHVGPLLDRFGVDLVVDVGARQGEYGRLLRRSGYGGRIASFEPVAVNLEVLEAQASSDPSWEVHGVALGSEDTVAGINVSPVTHFSSFRGFSDLGKARFPRQSVADAVEEVEVRRLDTLWPQVGAGARSVFLKVDTQGWDLEVLNGAAGVLGCVVGVQTELALQAVYEGAPLMHESLTALSSLGFEPTGFFPVAVHPDGRLIEVDCVAVRRP